MPYLYSEWCVVRIVDTVEYTEFTVLCKFGEDESRAISTASALRSAPGKLDSRRVRYEARLMTPPVSGLPYVKPRDNDPV